MYVACLIIYFVELIEDSFVVAYQIIFGGCLTGPEKNMYLLKCKELDTHD